MDTSKLSQAISAARSLIDVIGEFKSASISITASPNLPPRDHLDSASVEGDTIALRVRRDGGVVEMKFFL